MKGIRNKQIFDHRAEIISCEFISRGVDASQAAKDLESFWIS
jgi:hypothetical protein